VFSTRYLPLRFIVSAAIGHWSSSCYNMYYLNPKANINLVIVCLLDTVHTRVKVCKMGLEMCRLVEQPWLQLICYIVTIDISCIQ